MWYLQIDCVTFCYGLSISSIVDVIDTYWVLIVLYVLFFSCWCFTLVSHANQSWCVLTWKSLVVIIFTTNFVNFFSWLFNRFVLFDANLWIFSKITSFTFTISNFLFLVCHCNSRFFLVEVDFLIFPHMVWNWKNHLMWKNLLKVDYSMFI